MILSMMKVPALLPIELTDELDDWLVYEEFHPPERVTCLARGRKNFRKKAHGLGSGSESHKLAYLFEVESQKLK